MGAGFAAGEEIVDHMFGGGERRAGAGSEYDPGVNQDMGGADFGISNDSSWDDGASGSDSGW
ncbi:hypothetical protein [Novosphingobium sp. 18050]|nr:hypothetical protein [Novosphingobium sp. 18050]